MPGNVLLGGAVVAIGFVQWFFAYRDVAQAVAFALFLVVALYIVASLRWIAPPLSDSLEVVSLSLIYTLLTAALPWFFLSQELLLPAVYSLVLLLCLWHIHYKSIPLNGLGFSTRHLPRYLAIAVLVAIPLGLVEYLILRPAPGFPSFRLLGFFRDLVYMLFFVGLAEELLFRGLIQRQLIRAVGRWAGLFWAAALFMLMHFTWKSVPELGFVFLAGLILGYFYWRTGNLVGPIVVHGLGNLLLVGIFPYLLG